MCPTFSPAESVLKPAVTSGVMARKEYLENEEAFCEAVIGAWYMQKGNTLSCGTEKHESKAQELFELYSAIHEFKATWPLLDFNPSKVWRSLVESNLNHAWMHFSEEKNAKMAIVVAARDAQIKREAEAERLKM